MVLSSAWEGVSLATESTGKELEWGIFGNAPSGLALKRHFAHLGGILSALIESVSS